jgi:hypothetical protein
MSFERRTRRLKGMGGGGPIFLTIEGDPEIRRLQWLGQLPAGAMASCREAMIGDDHFVAAPDEATEAFHSWMRRIVIDRGKPYGFICLGHPSNAVQLKEAAPYPPTSGRDAATETRH